MIMKNDLVVKVLGKLVRVRIDEPGVVTVGERSYDFDGRGGLVIVLVDDRPTRIYIKKIKEYIFDIWLGAICLRVEVENARSRLGVHVGVLSSARDGENVVLAPMPGLITNVKVSIGDIVERGVALLVLEAMKMENEITSKIGGRVKHIMVKERSTVEKDQELIIIEAETE